MTITIIPVAGIAEVTAGDDLAALILESTPLEAADIVVVTSKIISKAEGRVLDVSDASERDALITRESVREVARRGSGPTATRIVETRHGFVMAAAGADVSDVGAGKIALLPLDPDESARQLRARLIALSGIDCLGVVITDTFGRPWRNGVVDHAIGAAGVQVLADLRGKVDRHGVMLESTVTAIGDELASAAELATGKATGRPISIIRGLSGYLLPNALLTTDAGAQTMIRSAAEDMFRLGTAEAWDEGYRAGLAARS